MGEHIKYEKGSLVRIVPRPPCSTDLCGSNTEKPIRKFIKTNGNIISIKSGPISKNLYHKYKLVCVDMVPVKIDCIGILLDDVGEEIYKAIIRGEPGLWFLNRVFIDNTVVSVSPFDIELVL